MRSKNLNTISLDQLRKVLKTKKSSQQIQDYNIPDFIWSGLNIPMPQKEFMFHDQRKWRIDYAWPEIKLAVEIEGGQYSRTITCNHCAKVVQCKGKDGKLHNVRLGGAHNSSRYSGDIEKYNQLTIHGWRLLRFTWDKINYDLIKMVFNGVTTK